MQDDLGPGFLPSSLKVPWTGEREHLGKGQPRGE